MVGSPAHNRFSNRTSFSLLSVYIVPPGLSLSLIHIFQEVWRVLKPGGTFMIVNESDGRNTKDEKWAGIIDGMRIFTQERLTQYLKDAGFSQIAAHVNRKQHWICLLAEKAR